MNCMGMLMAQSEGFNTCLSAGETVDEQLARLVSCNGGTSGGTIFTPPNQESPFYAMPDGAPVNLQPDGTQTKPGETLTEDPAPAPAPGSPPVAQPLPKTGLLQWVQENPLLVAGGVVLVMLAMKKRR